MINQNLAFRLCEADKSLQSSFSHTWEKDDFDMFLVEDDIYNILMIANPSEQVQLYVLNNSYYDHIFLDIHNPCEAARLLHVKKNGFNIQHIANPTKEMIHIALAWSKRTSYHFRQFPYSLYKYWYVSTLRIQAILFSIIIIMLGVLLFGQFIIL